MLSPETVITFFSASVLLALAPGPDNVFVLTEAALHGRVAGLLITLGLCTGLIVHTAAVALGVAAIVQTSPAAFAAMKYLGAAYLVYLAWQAFRAKGVDASSDTAAKPDYGKLYRRGIFMNVTNPKVSIFFLAFLPQFADPQRGSIPLQLVLLGGLFIVATAIVFSLIALLAGTLNKWFVQSSRVQIALNRVAAVVFVALALKLATTQR